jgi:hypothetical protein
MPLEQIGKLRATLFVPNVAGTARRTDRAASDREKYALIRIIIGTAAAATLAACSATAGGKAQSASSEAPARKGPGKNKGYDHNPYPSTYQAYPGVPTLLTNVTILDGEGGKIERGAVLFRDGKIVEVGQSIAAPEGASVIDGAGKYVTPGVIDVHSHLGDYPTPRRVRRIRTGTRRPGRSPPKCGPSTACGRRIRAFPARWPMGA